MGVTVTDAREGFILAEAIIFGIEAWSMLPEIHRPESNIDDLNALLKDVPMRTVELHRETAQRRLRVLLGRGQ